MVVLCRYGVEGLQIAQLEGGRGLIDDVGRLAQLLRRTPLSIGGYHLTLYAGKGDAVVEVCGAGMKVSYFGVCLPGGFSLGSHGSLHVLRQTHILPANIQSPFSAHHIPVSAHPSLFSAHQLTFPPSPPLLPMDQWLHPASSAHKTHTTRHHTWHTINPNERG